MSPVGVAPAAGAMAGAARDAAATDDGVADGDVAHAAAYSTSAPLDATAQNLKND
jgi:hypothetical protein